MDKLLQGATREVVERVKFEERRAVLNWLFEYGPRTEKYYEMSMAERFEAVSEWGGDPEARKAAAMQAVLDDPVVRIKDGL